MRSVLNTISSLPTFGKGRHAISANGGAIFFFQNSLDSFLSNSWPYDAISPLQAYLFGVFTCVVLFTVYNFFVNPSVPRRGVSRKRSPPWKRKNRNILGSGTTLPVNVNNYKISEEYHLPRPTVEETLSEDKVYLRLTSRIRERAESRVFQKSTRMTKDTPVNDFDYLGRCSVGRRTDSNRYEDSAKLICRLVNHHPIARNRARYNRKKTASRSGKGEAKNSAYNDSSIWTSSSAAVSKSSYELFRHMNTQPLQKAVHESFASEKVPLTHSSSSERCKDRDNHGCKAVRVSFDKENDDWQLMGSSDSFKSSKDAMARMKSRGTVVKKTREREKAKSVSPCRATPSAKAAALTDMQRRKNSNDMEGTSENIRTPVSKSKNSQANRQCFSEPPKKGTSNEYLQMQETEDSGSCLVKRIDQSLPGAKSILSQFGDVGGKSLAPKARLTVLISKGVYDYNQRANQQNALNLLDDLCIPYYVVDGMDPLQREIRNAFFEISGVRGNYPQIFSSIEFLGGSDWLNSCNIEELKKFACK